MLNGEYKDISKFHLASFLKLCKNMVMKDIINKIMMSLFYTLSFSSFCLGQSWAFSLNSLSSRDRASCLTLKNKICGTKKMEDCALLIYKDGKKRISNQCSAYLYINESKEQMKVGQDCHKKLLKYCDEDQRGSACYKRYKSKLPSKCHSKEIISILSMNSSSFGGKKIKESRCLKKIMKSCKLNSESDSDDKETQKSISSYQQCLIKQMSKEQEACKKELDGALDGQRKKGIITL